MTPTKAMRIVRAITDGLDTYPDKALPFDTSIKKTEIVRALKLAMHFLSKYESERPPRAGKPWDEMEIETLRASFKAGIRISKLARDHGRTRAAIEIRLAQLGLIEDKGTLKWMNKWEPN